LLGEREKEERERERNRERERERERKGEGKPQNRERPEIGAGWDRGGGDVVTTHVTAATVPNRRKKERRIRDENRNRERAIAE